MYAVRLWSVRHARELEQLYEIFLEVLLALDPVFRWIGYRRLEKPMARIEKAIKGFMFDCRMCGQCLLSQTGMACPMNCPKKLRNGPCGGVRADGMCEVDPGMRCVWVEGYEGSLRMRKGEAFWAIHAPAAANLSGTSSWLRAAREAVETRRAVR